MKFLFGKLPRLEHSYAVAEACFKKICGKYTLPLAADYLIEAFARVIFRQSVQGCGKLVKHVHEGIDI